MLQSVMSCAQVAPAKGIGQVAKKFGVAFC